MFPKNVRTKRVYDPPSPDDGRRVLITRYWPRGVPRAAADEYDPTLAPSRDLIRAYRSAEIGWPRFKQLFLDEMKGEPAQSKIGRLATIASEEAVTLMCICEDERRCHRTIVADLVEKAARR